MNSIDHSRRYTRLDSVNMQLSEYKIVVLGPATVGKSCVTIRYVSNQFSTEYNPTLQDTFRKTFAIDDMVGKMEILDTAGMEDYQVMQNHWIREGQGFVVMYAINNLDSFQEIKKIRQKIVRERSSNNFPMILVGNKSDLESQRKVTKQQGLELSQQFNCLFLETSAKDGTNCEKTFLDLCKAIKKDEVKDEPTQQKQKKGFKNWIFEHCELI